MDDSPRPLTDACMKLTGLGVRVAHTEQDLLQLWRIYVVYWQGVKPKDELLGFLHALAAEVRQIQADITKHQDADSGRWRTRGRGRRSRILLHLHIQREK